MADILDIENYISNLMRQGTTPDDLISKIMRCLYSIEDFFLAYRRRGARNAVRACIAHAQMLYEHERRMSAAREYLLRQIESLKIREKDLNFEISVLRAASTSGEYSGRKSEDELHDLSGVKDYSGLRGLAQSNNKSGNPDRESILCEIEKSEQNLSNLSEEITLKKQLLVDIDLRIEDASNEMHCEDQQNCSLGNSPSFFAPEPVVFKGLEWDGRARSFPASRPRGGVPRKQTRSYYMDMSDNIDITSEEFGASDRPSDVVPGVARSLSCEGYSRACTAGVREDVVTAAENVNEENYSVAVQEDLVAISQQQAENPTKIEEEALHTPIKGKRKAPVSPELNTEMEDSGGLPRRPNKARIIECEASVTETEQTEPMMVSDSEDSVIKNSEERLSSVHSEIEREQIITRSTRKKASDKITVAFDKLAASRADKMNKNINKDDTDKAFKSAIIDSDSDREVDSDKEIGNSGDARDLFKDGDALPSPKDPFSRKEEEDIVSVSEETGTSEMTDGTKSLHRKRKKKVVKKYSRETSEEEYVEEDSGKVGKIKSSTKGKKEKDKTVKNPIRSSRGKKKVPEVVNRDRVDLELGYTREKWLQMSSVDLGAVCLDHLAEIERQRYTCGNLSGRIDGMIKDCGAVATNIIGALTEKLEAVGDVPYLKAQNFKLREELAEARRKIDRQENEIRDLRKGMLMLEREVNALKEGNGPYVQHMKTPIAEESPKKSIEKSSEYISKKRQRQSIKLSSLEPRNSGPSTFSGGSHDLEYMSCGAEDWPPEQMDWTTAPSPDKEIHVEFANTNNTNGESKQAYKNKTKLATNSNSNLGKQGRKDIKITEVKQLVPPPTTSSPFPLRDECVGLTNFTNSEWRNVDQVNRKRQIPRGKILLAKTNQPIDTPESGSSAANSNYKKNNKVINKSVSVSKYKSKFKPAVVVIKGKPGGATYAQILSKAKQNVSLGNLGIQNLRMRRAVNGALVLELPGPDGRRLAGSLQSTLQDVLKEDATVNNPVATGEIRLRGIDPATTQEDVAYELEKLSGCPPKDLKVSAINVMKDGMGVAWVYCPLEYALKIAEIGSITLGWTVVRAELLKKRPVQCFRCWRFGHMRTNCRSDIDRVGACFRCGLIGHAARECNSLPKCVICAADNKESRHRIGTAICLQNQGFSVGVQNVRRVSRAINGGAVEIHDS